MTSPLRMTAAELLAAAAKPKGKQRVKNARRETVGDQSFDSRLEGRWWRNLLLRQRAGEISDLRRQVRILLLGRDGPILTPTGRQAHYVADFTYRDGDGRLVVADAKGWETEIYKLKRAILTAQGVTIRELR